ncbi:hypothetical protein P20652_2348 [Pseudoalteromonas sp. BSi20652]|uniref:hypothetical protein n=1 Tax=Pseudoalteromonas sp. BSi20652 TaxID=388384 RepID=UPI0002317B45|nr:hypothetical protein [Pseudoalteromonas sp. BSi20652]GAA60482.1 hypothetical protein P20652_2348 [Pseudoalteromonas sp. BSi20652]
MGFKNQYGQVSLIIENNVVIAHFKGYVTAGLLNAFKAELFETIKSFKGEPWAYISDSLDVLAATPEAEREMIDISRVMAENNCLTSAFVLTSAIAINQMKRILLCAKRNVNFSGSLFTDLDSAKQFISDNLKSKQGQLI